MVRIGIAGACGRMGKRIFVLAKADKEANIILGLESKGHPEVGTMIEGVKIIDNPEEIKYCECLIDFTTPQATLEHVSYGVKFKKAMVIGTTGLDEQQQNTIKDAAHAIPIVFSPNMSIGVNLLFRLAKETARVLPQYRIHIVEAHHAHKKDAPSGTAKHLKKIIENAGAKVDDIKALREGEIIGDHRVIFESELDRIELFHSAKTRDIFAQGALAAAHWLKNKGEHAGLFSIEDVIFN